VSTIFSMYLKKIKSKNLT